MRLIFGCFLLLFPLLFSSCDYSGQKYLKPKPSFEKVKGIGYTEVRRSFNSGLAFSPAGFYLEPSWKMKFILKDSVRLFNPLDNRSYNFHVHFDHDSVIYMARVWMRVKKVSSDSLVFRILSVKDRSITETGPNMTFYADKYIRNKLKTWPEILQMPAKKDSLFVKSRIRDLNQHADSIFLPQIPVRIESLDAKIQVKKKENSVGSKKNIFASEDPYQPEYSIVINKAYRDFNYSFLGIVDYKGNINFKSSTVYIMPEFQETRLRTIKGIIDVYLKPSLKVEAARTLGIQHNSMILINVKGIK
ncbi:hypothetical protein [Daejeonella oryzae]|uniref:hypothetical protein n=1 Tax=Daejeonella oryzae TaxID=1122943 RepID=UPI0003FFB270|nr:hypothetical protein [Daejeonella oryzae]